MRKLILCLIFLFVISYAYAEVTYKDGDSYIGENNDDPNWVWDLENLHNNEPKLGIENDFVWNDHSDKPVGVGGCINLPNNYVSICLDSLNVKSTDYKTYTFELDRSADLSQADGGTTTSASAIYMHTNQPNGFAIKTGGSANGELKANGTISNPTSDQVWLATCSGSLLQMGVYYKDSNGKTQMAGCTESDNPYKIVEINQGDIKIYIEDGENSVIIVKVIPSINQDILVYNDNITMAWKTSNGEFSSLGNTASLDEPGELVWEGYNETTSGKTPSDGYTPLQIGIKDKDLLSRYGIIIRDPKANGRSDQVLLEIPNKQAKAQISIKGAFSDTFMVPLGISIGGGDNGIKYYEKTATTTGTPAFEAIMVGRPDEKYSSAKYVKTVTSLTSNDVNYQTDVVLEVDVDAIKYYYKTKLASLKEVSPSNPLKLKFLGKELVVTSVPEQTKIITGGGACGAEGQSVYSNDVCCAGLSKVQHGWQDGTPNCYYPENRYLCTRCGDGTCNKLSQENSCNCPQDCGITKMECKPGQIVGDANGNGSIGLEDSELIAKSLAGKVAPPSNTCCVDANKNGKIDIGDSMFIAQVISGKRSSKEWGVCKYQTPTNQTCTESDKGLDYYTNGFITINGLSYDDKCVTPSADPYGGYVKKDGVYYMYNQGYPDVCSGNNCYIAEASCSVWGNSYEEFTLFKCLDGCKAGACITSLNKKPYVDIKINGEDGPLDVVSGTRAFLNWESMNAAKCSSIAEAYYKDDIMLREDHDSQTNGKEEIFVTSVVEGKTTDKWVITIICYSYDGASAEDNTTININPGSPNNLNTFPYPFVTYETYKDTILFVGATAPASDTLALVDIATMLQYTSKMPIEPIVKLDSEFTESQLYEYNIIAIGNPCDNKIIGRITPEYTCEKWRFSEGQAVIKITNKFGKGTMIVSGSTRTDTRRAAKVLANYKDYNLKGEEVCVTGTSFEDIKVKEGACTQKPMPKKCGNGICEGDEIYSCPKDCKEKYKCEEGSSLEYKCAMGTKVSWCSCLNNEWRCISSPESQCPQIKKCDGCYDEKKNCLPYGTRTGSDFCDIDGNFYVQLGDKGACKNNYECETNLCIDGECMSKGVWNKFISWLKAIFS